MSDLLAYLMDLTRVDCRQLKHSLKPEPPGLAFCCGHQTSPELFVIFITTDVTRLLLSRLALLTFPIFFDISFWLLFEICNLLFVIYLGFVNCKLRFLSCTIHPNF